jgi:hypothetical protein
MLDHLLNTGMRLSATDVADLRKALAAVEALEEHNAQILAFSTALGFGDSFHEPTATLDDMLESIQQAFSEAQDHVECPVTCEQCGDRVASQLCPECGGSGANNAASTVAMAWVECDYCGGSRKVHDCPCESLADVVGARDKCLAQVERLRFTLNGWADGQIDEPYAALKEALDGGGNFATGGIFKGRGPLVGGGASPDCLFLKPRDGGAK